MIPLYLRDLARQQTAPRRLPPSRVELAVAVLVALLAAGVALRVWAAL